MRDLLILGIVLSVLPFALLHPRIGVLLWTWISIMNPHRLAFGFAFSAPFGTVAAAVVFLSLFITRDKIRMPWASPVVALLLFVLWMCLTTAFAIDPAGSLTQLEKVLKIQLMTGVALMVLHERRHIELFVWVNVLSIGFYGLKGGIFTLLTGGQHRVWGPDGSFIGDNNTLAVAIIIVIPLINYLRMVATRRAVRLGLLALMVLCGLSALGSQSRGALVAITAMTLFLWHRSNRKIVFGVAIASVASALLAFMPSSWDERMGSIGAYETDESAQSRFGSWGFCIKVANDRPLGGGFDVYGTTNYAIYAPAVKGTPVAHSIYFSVLGEHGYVGLGLFLLLWWLTWREAARMRKESAKRSELAWIHALAGMCQVSLIGYLVGGAFLQLAYFDLPYNIMVMVVVARRWMRQEDWKRETSGAFGSGNPVTGVQLAHPEPVR